MYQDIGLNRPPPFSFVSSSLYSVTVRFGSRYNCEVMQEESERITVEPVGAYFNVQFQHSSLATKDTHEGLGECSHPPDGVSTPRSSEYKAEVLAHLSRLSVY
jgi:hypothetical protein